MDINTIASSPLSGLLAQIMGPLMNNDFRRRHFSAEASLSGAGLQAGQVVLEVGCGNGFYTLPAAKILAGSGSLIAIDPFAEAIRDVKTRLEREGLTKVRLMQTDGLHTGLPDATIDLVLLFGVIPAPTVSLDTLLPELSRMLKPQGRLAVWPPFPWLPWDVGRRRVFKYEGKNQGVFIFSRLV